MIIIFAVHKSSLSHLSNILVPYQSFHERGSLLLPIQQKYALQASSSSSSLIKEGNRQPYGTDTHIHTFLFTLLLRNVY